MSTGRPKPTWGRTAWFFGKPFLTCVRSGDLKAAGRIANFAEGLRNASNSGLRSTAVWCFDRFRDRIAAAMAKRRPAARVLQLVNEHLGDEKTVECDANWCSAKRKTRCAVRAATLEAAEVRDLILAALVLSAIGCRADGRDDRLPPGFSQSNPQWNASTNAATIDSGSGVAADTRGQRRSPRSSRYRHWREAIAKLVLAENRRFLNSRNF